MAFSSLVASNKCGRVGDIWVNTTIAFDPDEITTVPPITTLTVISTPTVEAGITYNYIITALTTQPSPAPLTYADLGQNCSNLPGYVYFPDNPINAANADWVHDPCHPVIQVPDRLLSAQPAWASAQCRMPPGVGGAYDPPHALTLAASLDVPTPSAMPASSATSVARQTSVTALYDNSGQSSLLVLGASSTAATLPYADSLAGQPSSSSATESSSETSSDGGISSRPGTSSDAAIADSTLMLITSSSASSKGASSSSTSPSLELGQSGTSSSVAAATPASTGSTSRWKDGMALLQIWSIVIGIGLFGLVVL
ncbi:hypothetical protein MBLNU459_g1266t1 [Dothideomycetes sp. NU459]